MAWRFSGPAAGGCPRCGAEAWFLLFWRLPKSIGPNKGYPPWEGVACVYRKTGVGLTSGRIKRPTFHPPE